MDMVYQHNFKKNRLGGADYTISRVVFPCFFGVGGVRVGVAISVDEGKVCCDPPFANPQQRPWLSPLSHFLFTYYIADQKAIDLILGNTQRPLKDMYLAIIFCRRHKKLPDKLDLNFQDFVRCFFQHSAVKVFQSLCLLYRIYIIQFYNTSEI